MWVTRRNCDHDVRRIGQTERLEMRQKDTDDPAPSCSDGQYHIRTKSLAVE